MLQAAESGFTESLARGAVFFDCDAKAPERLWLFRGLVGDGTGRLLSQRLFAVREIPGAAGSDFAPAHPIRLHDLRPRADGELPPLTDFDVRKHAATRYCLEQLVPRFVDEVASGRLKELMERLAASLTERGIRGMSARSLYRFRALYEAYQDILPEELAKSPRVLQQLADILPEGLAESRALRPGHPSDDVFGTLVRALGQRLTLGWTQRRGWAKPAHCARSKTAKDGA